MFGEIVPKAKYEGQRSPGEITTDAPDVKRHAFKMPNGEPFFVYRTDDEVWFQVSRLEEGRAGNALYAATGDYAFNSGRVFIGPPEGLSEIALRRRTEAMLSTAFKHGTTEHIAPHEYQVRGDESLGVPPLRWRDGDHLANMQTLIDVSVESLAHHVPEFRRARYDFDTGTFRNAQGAPITNGNLREWSSKFGRVRAARAGVRTLKRNILFNTISRTSSGQRPGLLEQALRQPGELVGESLIGAFSETEAQFTAAADRALFFAPAVRFVEGAKQKQASAGPRFARDLCLRLDRPRPGANAQAPHGRENQPLRLHRFEPHHPRLAPQRHVTATPRRVRHEHLVRRSRKAVA